MDELTKRVYTLLNAVNLHPLYGGGALTLPRLRAPMAVVYPISQTVESVAADDLLAKGGATMRGRLLTQEMAVDVYAPFSASAETCLTHADKVVQTLLASEDTLGVASLTVGKCEYDRRLDCRICRVRFTLRMYRYTLPIEL